VSDLDKALDFYKKLGFEQAFANVTGGKTTEVFLKVNDRQFIEVYPQTNPSQALGWMHVCYESDALDALYTLYAARGLKPTPVVKAGAGNLLFTFKDPEGRTTEFTQYMPGSRHTLDKGLHLGANRISEKMLGFDLPVADLAAAKQFYVAGLGFVAKDEKAGLSMSVPGDPDLRIELRTAGTDRPESVFLVANVAKAAKQLKDLGLNGSRNGKRVSVADPDGNVLVFVEKNSD
jgi:catechol 2,3-dioxygenase-like lactoylglutathione lyase family enzyme